MAKNFVETNRLRRIINEIPVGSTVETYVEMMAKVASEMCRDGAQLPDLELWIQLECAFLLHKLKTDKKIYLDTVFELPDSPTFNELTAWLKSHDTAYGAVEKFKAKLLGYIATSSDSDIASVQAWQNDFKNEMVVVWYSAYRYDKEPNSRAMETRRATVPFSWFLPEKNPGPPD